VKTHNEIEEAFQIHTTYNFHLIGTSPPNVWLGIPGRVSFPLFFVFQGSGIGPRFSALPCASIQAYFMAHPWRSTPSFFFKFSFSIFRRAFSAHTRKSSIYSEITVLPPAGLSFPAFAAFTQLRGVCSTKPRSLATARMPWPLLTRCATPSLNSGVYSCFGILNIFSPSSQLMLYPTSWKTKFRGRLKHQSARMHSQGSLRTSKRQLCRNRCSNRDQPDFVFAFVRSTTYTTRVA